MLQHRLLWKSNLDIAMFPQLLFMGGRNISIQVKPNRKYSHQLLLIPNIGSTLGLVLGSTVIRQLLGSVKLLVAVITVELIK